MKILFLLIPLFIFYLIYTLRYTIEFRKNILFNKGVKFIHYILFWIIPFFWILLIKNLSKDTKGTDYYYRHRSWMDKQEGAENIDPTKF